MLKIFVSLVLCSLASLSCCEQKEGWWTYRYCHGQHVSQFHVEGNHKPAWCSHADIISPLCYVRVRASISFIVELLLWRSALPFQFIIVHKEIVSVTVIYKGKNFCKTAFQIGTDQWNLQKQGRDQSMQEDYPTTEQWQIRKTRRLLRSAVHVYVQQMYSRVVFFSVTVTL